MSSWSNRSRLSREEESEAANVQVQDPGDAERTSYTFPGIVLCELETRDFKATSSFSFFFLLKIPDPTHCCSAAIIYCLLDVPFDSSFTVKHGREKGTERVSECDWSDCSLLDNVVHTSGLWTLDEDTGLLLI